MPTQRPALVLVLLGSLIVVGAALLFQYVGGLAPCELCLLERWPYYLAIPLALIGLAAGRQSAIAGAGVVLLTLLFLASTALAFYHFGVEQHWFAGPTACTGGPTGAQTVEELKAQLMAQAAVRCDVPQWSLFGVSLAGWNVFASAALAALALGAIRERPSRARA